MSVYNEINDLTFDINKLRDKVELIRKEQIKEAEELNGYKSMLNSILLHGSVTIPRDTLTNLMIRMYTPMIREDGDNLILYLEKNDELIEFEKSGNEYIKAKIQMLDRILTSNKEKMNE